MLLIFRLYSGSSDTLSSRILGSELTFRPVTMKLLCLFFLVMPVCSSLHAQLSPGCPTNACNFVNNGGFESGTGCGQLTQDPMTIDCWLPYLNSPDYYVRNCVTTAWPAVTVPSSNSLPPSDTWNNGVGNNKFLGLWNVNASTCESIQTQLGSSLLPNIPYILSFWARFANNVPYTSGPGSGSLVFAAASSQGAAAYAVVPSLPASLTQLASVQVPANNQWNYFSVAITHTAPIALNWLSVFNAGWLTAPGSTYIYIDDISIATASAAASFTPPPVCRNQVITSLGAYASAPGGSFSGQGVMYDSNTGFYGFNTGANLPTGTYPIIYSYTLNGCPGMVTQSISVANTSVVPASQTICAGQTATVTGFGATTYSWSTGATTQYLIASPTITSVYTITGNSCPETATVMVTQVGTSLSASSGTVCKGNAVVLMASGANTYSWSTGSNNTVISVTPAATSYYTVTGTAASSTCAAAKTITITVAPCTAIETWGAGPERVKIYPNPTTGTAYFETTGPVRILLYDWLGRQIKESIFCTGRHVLDLEACPPGVYVLKIIDDKGMTEKKLVKAAQE
jgi:hypothetical protein